MPRAKRPPIDYTPQFGAGIFRPKDAVAEDLANLDQPAAAPVSPATTPEPGERPTERLTDRSDGRTSERTNERTVERLRVRHSFDIWQDQLLALTELQTRIFGATGRKPKLGELVQDALDRYLATQQDRPNVRTNERTNKGDAE